MLPIVHVDRMHACLASAVPSAASVPPLSPYVTCQVRLPPLCVPSRLTLPARLRHACGALKTRLPTSLSTQGGGREQRASSVTLQLEDALELILVVFELGRTLGRALEACPLLLQRRRTVARVEELKSLLVVDVGLRWTAPPAGGHKTELVAELIDKVSDV